MSWPPLPAQRTDDGDLREESIPRRSASVDAVSGVDPAVKGYRSAFRDLAERAAR